MILEKDTRLNLIDTALEKAGWYVENPEHIELEFYDFQDEKKLFADYILKGRDGKPLAIIEAKSADKSAQIAKEQAKQYCIKIGKKYNCTPFCYFTNGTEIYFWDIDNYPPRKIMTYPTLNDLERLNFIRKERRSLEEVRIDKNIAGRPYQIQAIRNVLESISKKHRKQLLIMATGTGKTRVATSLVQALKSARWIKRVLFLVDRIALREQALETFEEMLPHELTWPQEGEIAFKKNRDIYVCTYPTMKNIVETEMISSAYFDLIIVDESHRSVYNTYGDILNYFDSIQIGLTATPTDAVDHNTFKLFECPDGVPTFAYTYKEAVCNNPKYLSDFNVQKIVTLFQKDGMSKRTISLKQQMDMLKDGKDKELNEVNYEGSELEKTVINRGTNVEIIKTFMEDCIKDDDGVIPGKTIIFCMTIGHAYRVEQIINELYPEYCGELAKTLVSEDSRVHGKGGLLDQFKTCNMPRIAISVDMLDTGVDVREVVNLVFAKPVYSYTKFWQMIGRGTRLLDEKKKKSWCKKKDEFLIFDCWDNFEYFNINPEGRTIAEQIALPVKYFRKIAEKIKIASEKKLIEIYKQEVYELLNLISMLPKESIMVKENLRDINDINEEFFIEFSEKKYEKLINIVAPLFKSLSGVDFKAMRFEKDVLEATIFKMNNQNDKLHTQIENIAQQVSELPLTINSIRENKELIDDIQRKEFWVASTDQYLKLIGKKLAPLMYLRNIKNDEIKKYDFSDKIIINERYKFEASGDVKIEEYIKNVEEKIRQLESDNETLKKIKSGQKLNDLEIERLEQELSQCEVNITTHNLRVAYKYDKASFIQLIKHVLGIQKLENYPFIVAAKFDSFITNHTTLNSSQLNFIQQLKEYCINNYEIKKRNLLEAPFTLIHPKGIFGVFGDKEIKEIVELIEGLVA